MPMVTQAQAPVYRVVIFSTFSPAYPPTAMPHSQAWMSPCERLERCQLNYSSCWPNGNRESFSGSCSRSESRCGSCGCTDYVECVVEVRFGLALRNKRTEEEDHPIRNHSEDIPAFL